MVNLAAHWGVSPVWLSNIASDPNRADKWNRALAKLPHLRRREHRELSEERIANSKSKTETSASESHYGPAEPSQEPTAPAAAGAPTTLPSRGMRHHDYATPGSEFVATCDIGEFGAEGDYFHIVATRSLLDNGEIVEHYLIENEAGAQEWFGPQYLDEEFAQTGRVR